MRNTGERLRDILEVIVNIERYAGRGRQAFEQDELLQNYFLSNCKLLVRRRALYPRRYGTLPLKFPGAVLFGMHSILVHGYFDIDTEVFWDVVEDDIPEQSTPHFQWRRRMFLLGIEVERIRNAHWFGPLFKGSPRDLED